ncbi:MAG: hypothetical protein ACRDE7_00965, partial [Sphingobacterium sp.]
VYFGRTICFFIKRSLIQSNIHKMYELSITTIYYNNLIPIKMISIYIVHFHIAIDLVNDADLIFDKEGNFFG